MADPLFNTVCPTSFFTNVAGRLVYSELNLNLNQLSVYPTNQYTPAVQRLLQVAANVYDATTTSRFPTVFRPLFSSDTAGTNVFITGYQQVISVTGVNDAQLAAPVDARTLTAAQAPFTNVASNVYGIPWIIGAKKGLPNFNTFYVLNGARVTRKLLVRRENPSIPGATATNQMLMMTITNRLGFAFWNAYNDDYVPSSGQVTICLRDSLSMILTNDASSWSAFNGQPDIVQQTFVSSLTNWPGANWNIIQSPPYQNPSSSSFVTGFWDFCFLPLSVYQSSTSNFVPVASAIWETNEVMPSALPQFGLMTTNRLQAFILDGTNVLDYVQLCGPDSARDLKSEINDPNYIGGTPYYMWSTNVFGLGQVPTWGVVNQINVSRLAPSGTILSFWSPPSNLPAGLPATPSAEAAYFNGFFVPYFIYNGNIYVNTNVWVQAPYIPSRTVYEYTSWQANDPLVHYLKGDLNTITVRMGLHKADDLTLNPLPNPNLATTGEHYQPWGRNQQMVQTANTDASAYNESLRDPLVWKSDDWNFPTGQSWNLSWLGRVHRGTPWQTIYLKSFDLLQEVQNETNIGTNTWKAWSGTDSPLDIISTSPGNDRQLVSLLAELLNTNDPLSQFSVNNPDPAAWAALLNGMTALTNTTAYPYAGAPLTFDPLTIAADAIQTTNIVAAIITARATQPYHKLGDVLSISQLSEQSPFLNTGVSTQLQYGITDEAYEAIPSQLLPLLRSDSFGTMLSTNGLLHVQFDGYDGHNYAIQSSINLMDWTSFSTNIPHNGIFEVMVPSKENGFQFYRSLFIH